MPHYPCLPEVDNEVTHRIEEFSEDFWISANRDYREDTHAYFQYPAMMVPGIQKELIKLFINVQPTIKYILDPFVGAGTTMTASMSFGLNFSGQDINPLAILISKAKTGPFNYDALQKDAQEVVCIAKTDSSSKVDVNFNNINKWFQTEIQIQLSKIRRAVKTRQELWTRRFMWVALAETVRLASNSRTSTYKLHSRPQDEINKRNISAIELFEDILHRSMEDLYNFKKSLSKNDHLAENKYTGEINIYLQNSSEKIVPSTDETQLYDLLITSPPYGDNTSTVPYGQFSYLPLQWIDFHDICNIDDSQDWLRSTCEIDRRSIGGRNKRDIEPLMNSLSKKSQVYREIAENLTEQPDDRLARVTTFIYDLDKTLDPIVSSLKNNAYLIWFIGNRHVGGYEIPTDTILSDVLKSRKVVPVSKVTRKLLFRRMATRNRISTMMRQENILVFRKSSDL